MTVIALKDGIMAADTQSWQGSLKIGCASKLHRLKIGICGFSGWKPVIEQAIAWLENVSPLDYEHENRRTTSPGARDDWQISLIQTRPRAADEGDLSGIILRPDESIWNLSYKFDVYPTIAPINVCGAHPEFLYGAMLAGASAEEAIRLAIRHCEFAGGEVEVMQL